MNLPQLSATWGRLLSSVIGCLLPAPDGWLLPVCSSAFSSATPEIWQCVCVFWCFWLRGMMEFWCHWLCPKLYNVGKIDLSRQLFHLQEKHSFCLLSLFWADSVMVLPPCGPTSFTGACSSEQMLGGIPARGSCCCCLHCRESKLLFLHWELKPR